MTYIWQKQPFSGNGFLRKFFQSDFSLISDRGLPPWVVSGTLPVRQMINNCFQFIHSKERFCSFFVHLSIILVNIIKHIRSLEMLQFPHQQQTNNRSLFWNRDWSYPQLWLASIWNSIELIFLKRGLHWHFRKFL